MQLSLQTDQTNADLVSEVLMGLNSVSITYLDTHDNAIYEPPVGETPLWQHVTINALFEMGVDQSHVSKTLLNLCNTKILHFSILLLSVSKISLGQLAYPSKNPVNFSLLGYIPVRRRLTGIYPSNEKVTGVKTGKNKNKKEKNGGKRVENC